VAEPISESLPVEDRSLFFAPSTWLKCGLTWLVPGLGYFLLGKKRSGLIIAISIFSATALGALLGGDLYPLMSDSEGWMRQAGSVCQLGAGLPYFVVNLLLSRGTPLSVTYDYGTNYFLIAGMINWLSVMDVFDIAVKRK
jgi:hypothetical protein